MKSSLERLFAVWATIAAAGFATPVLAQAPVSVNGVTPQQFSGELTCTSPEIEAFCNFVDDPTNLDDGPIELLVPNPLSSGTKSVAVNRPVFSGSVTFQVDVTLSGGKFSYEDQSIQSTPPGVPAFPDENQQADTPGTDCVLVKGNLGGGGGTITNVYRRVNSASDTGLGVPSGSLNRIRFCWAEGACKETQANVDTSCGDWNQDDDTPEVEFLQGYLPGPDQLFNLCGCSSAVRNCDPNVPAEQGGCFATGAGVSSLDTQAAATAEAPPPSTALGFSALATTITSCPTATDPDQCLRTYTTTGGGTTTTSTFCAPESTKDADTTCP